MKARLLVFALLLLVALASSATAQESTDVEELFADANQAYEDQDYSRAIENYMAILDRGVESAPVYFNLGNAWFRQGDLGRAVLYYEKARRIDPGNEDIRTNLEFASRFTGVKMEGVRLNPIDKLLEGLVDPYRLDTLAWIASAMFVLFTAVLIVRFGFGIAGSGVRFGIIASLVLLLAAAMITTYKYRHDYLTRRVVIIAEDAPVRTGPYEHTDTELEGAPGLVVEIVDETDDYYDVLFENSRRGWIKKSFVAEI